MENKIQNYFGFFHVGMSREEANKKSCDSQSVL